MNHYYLRAVPATWSTLLTLGERLGAIQTIEGATHATDGGAWDYIGEIHRPTGAVDEEGLPVLAPVTDAGGAVYLHANLLTPLDLRAAAEALAPADPDIAQALATLGAFFVTDATGQAVAPAAPHRVFFGEAP